MKLTSREKTMLIVLAAVAVIALSYFLLFKPQLDKIKVLALQDLTKKIEMTKTEAELTSGAKLDSDINTLGKELGDKTKLFFPAILEDKLLVVMNGLINSSQVKSNSGKFGEIKVSTIVAVTDGKDKNSSVAEAYPLKDMADQYNNTNNATAPATQATPTTSSATQVNGDTNAKPVNVLENLNVALNFTCTNDQLMSFIKQMEALDKSIVISNISIAAKENSILNVEINLTFYALPKILEQDKDFLDWAYNNQYGKSNPYRAPVAAAATQGNTAGSTGTGTGGGQGTELVP